MTADKEYIKACVLRWTEYELGWLEMLPVIKPHARLKNAYQLVLFIINVVCKNKNTTDA